MWVRIAITLICCAAATRGWARDIYVNNVTGEDRFDGSAPVPAGEQVGPHRTLARALKATAKGDRLIVANTGQPYRESITLQGARQSGYPDAPFQLVGNGAVLDGSEQVLPDDWSFVGGNVFRFRPSRMSFQVLYLDGKPAQRRDVRAAADIDALEPLQWCLYERHVYFRTEPGRLPPSYALSYTARQVGITLYEVRHVVVKDLVIQGFLLDGVNAHDGVRETVLDGLNCRGNGRSGISVGGASRVRITACLVGNNGAAQVRTEGYSHAQLVGCDLLDNTAPRIVQDGGRVDEAN
jgi:hypothetical protein